MIIRAEKLRWLLWLRWKLLVRSFNLGPRGTTGMITKIIVLLVFFGGSIALAVYTYFGYRLPTPANAEVLFLILTAIYVLWVVGPLAGTKTNESVDLSKLLLFPLSRSELVVNLLTSALLNTSTLWLAFFFIAIAVGWALSLPMLLFVLLTILVFYIQLVGMSQLLMALFAGAVQNRRLRDIATVAMVLLISGLGVSCQLSFMGLQDGMQIDLVSSLRSAPFSPYLQWLPSGMAARAIQQASIGHWSYGFVWLTGLFVLSLLALFLWSLVFERSLTGSESGGTVKHSTRRVVVSHPASSRKARSGSLQRVLPPQVLALMHKDLKYIRRDPQLLIMYGQSLLSATVFMGYLVVTAISQHDQTFLPAIGPWIMFIAPIFGAFSLYTTAYNILGYERQNLTRLLLFPIQPRYILWGKNLVVFFIGLSELVVLLGLVAVLTGAWSYFLPAFTIGLTAIALTIASGNVTSVFSPQYVPQIRRGAQSSANMFANGGCLRYFLSSLSIWVVFIFIVPVIAAMVLPSLFHVQWIWFFAIPLSLVYCWTIYYFVTQYVAPRMLTKTPEIIEITTRVG